MIRKITALLLLFLFVTGCKDNDGGKAESSEMESLAYTLYTDKIELFVEFKPLVIGETTKFAAHFTTLGDTFKSLDEGRITVSLIVGGKGIRNTVKSASSPGIFRLALKPETTGKGKLVFDIQTRYGNDRIEIPNVEVFANEEVAKKAARPKAPSGGISYLKEQAWKVEFANVPAQRKTFHEIIRTNGQLLSALGDEMVITAKADGIVRFTGNNATNGKPVSEGTALFTISGSNLAKGNIDSQVRESRMSYLKLKADYERAQELAKDQIISQKEFQTTKLMYENARNDFNTISKNFTANGQRIIAPMSGFVKTVTVSDGQFVQAGTPLATVTKNKKLLLQANVSQRYFGKLPTITSANFSIPNGSTYDTQKLNGKVVSYGKSASVDSPFLPITFEIDNTQGIVSGSGVEVFLKSTAKPNALIIPMTAIQEEQGVFYVYIQTAGETFDKREVTLGANDGNEVEILSGIKDGERVVTKGGYQIKLSVASGALPAHGHEH